VDGKKRSELTTYARLAELLLDSGADVNAVAPAGWSMLYLAAQEGDVGEMLWLLGEGADPNLPCQEGASPLQAACLTLQREAAAVLLAHGAAVSLPREAGFCAGYPPLHLVCAGPLREPEPVLSLLRMLLLSRANPNETDEVGSTPLRLLARAETAVEAAAQAAEVAAAAAAAQAVPAAAPVAPGPVAPPQQRWADVIPHPSGLFKWAVLILVGAVVVLVALTRVDVESNAYVELVAVRPGCSWREEFINFNLFLCFRFRLEKRPFETKPPVSVGRGTRCDGVLCGRLFEQHRGGDVYVSFDELHGLDRAVARRVRSTCVWPAALMESDVCWLDASDGGTKELAARDVCAFVACRAGRGSGDCLRAACSS